jgi:hypothetical protein
MLFLVDGNYIPPPKTAPPRELLSIYISVIYADSPRPTRCMVIDTGRFETRGQNAKC